MTTTMMTLSSIWMSSVRFLDIFSLSGLTVPSRRPTSCYNIESYECSQLNCHVRIALSVYPSLPLPLSNSPPLSWYSRKPVVVLSDTPEEDREKGERVYEDSLDRHVNDVLKRPSKFKPLRIGQRS